jgi:hypothetical protein
MPMLSGVGFPMHRDLDVVYCTSPIEFSNQPPYPLSTGAMLAPPTREQWYLLTSPFLPEADGTVSRKVTLTLILSSHCER